MTEHEVGTAAEAEQELTDRETLQEKISALELRLKATKNLWQLNTLNQLYDRLDTMFNEDGSAIPPEPVASQLVVDFSPQEAQEAEGYWTHIPSGYGDLPPWLGKSNPTLGLTITHERHAACVGIKHLDDTADLWINDPQGAAQAVSVKRTSPRILAMAGYAMAGFKYMLPMFDHGGVKGLLGFAVLPEIPMNNDERVAYEKNWGKYQAKHAFAGTNFGAFANSLKNDGQVVWNDDPTASRDDWKIRVDPVGQRHLIPTIINHPHWIVPALMDVFNTTKFLHMFYASARRLAFRIDNHGIAPVPGYVKKDRAYVKEFERHDRGSAPTFKAPGI